LGTGGFFIKLKIRFDNCKGVRKVSKIGKVRKEAAFCGGSRESEKSGKSERDCIFVADHRPPGLFGSDVYNLAARAYAIRPYGVPLYFNIRTPQLY
jgi:hypothetical protein